MKAWTLTIVAMLAALGLSCAPGKVAGGGIETQNGPTQALILIGKALVPACKSQDVFSLPSTNDSASSSLPKRRFTQCPIVRKLAKGLSNSLAWNESYDTTYFARDTLFWLGRQRYLDTNGNQILQPPTLGGRYFAEIIDTVLRGPCIARTHTMSDETSGYLIDITGNRGWNVTNARDSIDGYSIFPNGFELWISKGYCLWGFSIAMSWNVPAESLTVDKVNIDTLRITASENDPFSAQNGLYYGVMQGNMDLLITKIGPMSNLETSIPDTASFVMEGDVYKSNERIGKIRKIELISGREIIIIFDVNGGEIYNSEN
jgi:hypothetical protein